MNKEIEYYEFRYKIPKYKIKPPLNFSKYYQIHKDEIIIDLQQENKQLKDNWNYIKKMLKEVRQEKFNVNGYCGTCTDVDIDFLLNKMKELEQGSDNK